MTAAEGVGVAAGAGGAGGVAIFGGASGCYHTSSYIRKYEEIKSETEKLCVALRELEGKQKELHIEGKRKQTEIELIESE